VYHTPQSMKSWRTQLFEERRGDICNRTWGDRTTLPLWSRS
jgi:hypothetical protein